MSGTENTWDYVLAREERMGLLAVVGEDEEEMSRSEAEYEYSDMEEEEEDEDLRYSPCSPGPPSPTLSVCATFVRAK